MNTEQLIVVKVGFQARDLLQLIWALWMKYMFCLRFYHIIFIRFRFPPAVYCCNHKVNITPK